MWCLVYNYDYKFVFNILLFSKWGLYSNINTYKWNISSNITMYYGVFTFNLKMYNLFYHEWWKKPNQIIKNPNKLPKPKWKKIFLFSKYESSFRIFRICIDFIEFIDFDDTLPQNISTDLWISQSLFLLRLTESTNSIR